MKRLAALIIAVGFTAAACGEPIGDGPGDPGGPTTTTSAPSPSADIMAAALAQVAGVDHTFGSGPPPFDIYLVQNKTDPQAGADPQQAVSRSLTEAERSAVEASLAPLGEVRWIDDPAEYRTRRPRSLDSRFRDPRRRRAGDRWGICIGAGLAVVRRAVRDLADVSGRRGRWRLAGHRHRRSGRGLLTATDSEARGACSAVSARTV